jgi:hypothetical protein
LRFPGIAQNLASSLQISPRAWHSAGQAELSNQIIRSQSNLPGFLLNGLQSLLRSFQACVTAADFASLPVIVRLEKTHSPWRGSAASKWSTQGVSGMIRWPPTLSRMVSSKVFHSRRSFSLCH